MAKRTAAGRDGFTLVELIVCLVIVSVLAAIAIPTMLGYAGKARESALGVECRSCILAAQTLASQYYAQGRADPAPTPEEVRTLAEVQGTVSGLTVVNGRLTHLTYARDGRWVTYCADPESCADHERRLTFGTGDPGTGGGSTGGETGGTGGETGGGTGGSTKTGSVTLQDSSGAKHTLTATAAWSDFQKKLADTGANMAAGTLLSDGSAVYACITWPTWEKKTYSSMADYIAAHAANFVQLTDSTTIWITANQKDTGNGTKWPHAIQKGELCYSGGSYYVAAGTVTPYTFPPGGWVAILG